MKECPRCLRCEDDSVSVCPADGTPLNATLDGAPLIDEKYLLERRLGEGGMGIIYRARHRGLPGTDCHDFTGVFEKVWLLSLRARRPHPDRNFRSLFRFPRSAGNGWEPHAELDVSESK
jgi:hypothetical protein